MKKNKIMDELILPLEAQKEYLDGTWKKRYRFIVLALVCSYVIGNYFCYDYPAALELQIEEEFNVSVSKYGLLYTGFAVPNLFMPVLGGIMFDRIGTRNALLIFTIILCVGQGLFTLGGYNMNFNLMFIGRIVFGVGCEAMYVGQSAIVSDYFINYELPLGMSMISCIPLIGSFVGGALQPVVYNKSGFGPCFLMGFLVCVGCATIVVALYIFDFFIEKKDKEWFEEYKQRKKERGELYE